MSTQTVEEIRRTALDKFHANHEDGDIAINEAIEAINAVRRADMEAVIGQSPQNPYGAKDAFFHEWGYQASEYDKFLRAEQRKRMEERLNA